MKKPLAKYFTIFHIAILLLLTGCFSDSVKEHTNDPHHETITEKGDIREETKSIHELPTFLKNHPKEIKTIYKAASYHQDLLEYIPCYCGCGDYVGHKNNYDCFINENKNNGAIVWDDHGTKCQICLDIAATAILEKKKGQTLQQIRQTIDQIYQDENLEPTPTPMPK